MNSSASMMLSRLFVVTSAHQIQVMVSGAAAALENDLKQAAINSSTKTSLLPQFVATMDGALEWYEENQLQHHNVDIDLPLDLSLDEWFGSNKGDDVIRQLMIYMDILSLSSGQQLFDVNALTDSIYIVKSGTLDITVIADDSLATQIPIRPIIMPSSAWQ